LNAKNNPKPDSFVEAVASFIDEKKLIEPASHILVGVSGGADSVALLWALYELSLSGADFKLSVAHLDHGLRDDSARDSEFVAGLAEKLSLPCVIEKRDVKARAEKQGQGIEQAGRMVRYEFLQEAAESCGAKYIAVGQHSDDNVETVLYRIIRGTHLRGISGIPLSRKLTGSDITLIRPLLGMRRDQVEAYCERKNLSWRTDSTNTDISFRRNFIRHELLPLLRDKLNPRTDEAIERISKAAQEMEQYLTCQKDSLLETVTTEVSQARRILDIKALSSQPEALQTFVLREILESLGIPMRTFGADRFTDIKQLLLPTGPAAMNLPGGFIARREGSELVLEKLKDQESPPIIAEEAFLDCPSQAQLADGRNITCSIEGFDKQNFVQHCKDRPAGVEILDADKVIGRLVVRSRRDGDTFGPLGLGGTQSVSDFLTNLKLPRAQRDKVLCICDELGIIYLAPLRIDNRLRVTESTKRTLKISLI